MNLAQSSPEDPIIHYFILGWAYTRPDVYVSDSGGLIQGWAYTRVGLSVAVYSISQFLQSQIIRIFITSRQNGWKRFISPFFPGNYLKFRS